MDDNDQKDDEWEGDVSLFEEGDEAHASGSSNGSHRQKGDGGEASSGPGRKTIAH